MKKELWRDIKDYKDLYQGSNLGRVRSLDRWVKCPNGSVRFYKGRILKPGTNKDGYLQIDLCKNNKSKTFRVNRLVAEAFLEIPEELRHLKGTRYLQVNHKDEDKTNNNVENLEWCSAKYNTNYGTAIKRRSLKKKKSILQYTMKGEFVKEWDSIAECGRNGFHQGNVAACCQGKRKSHHKFIWRYK